jgi:UDP-N-acetylglucosamine--N-acetylmuramyl-(pentapeptide) pyrophosphoryl-undecaprenol N-acetylglucosamine transferase
MIFLVIGLIQCLWLMARVKPKVVFVKGGYVGLPVGAAAAFWHRPIITHDSDTLPGLTNRIVARWARLMATAYPAEMYTYPSAKVRYVGVPIDAAFKSVTTEQKRVFRERLGMPADAQVVLITGGSLGAVRLNQAVAAIAPVLLKIYPKLYLIHQTGAKSGTKLHEAAQEYRDRIATHEFFRPSRTEALPGSAFADYSGAADIVIARPGATTMAELAAQDKACIVVPSPFLAEGHQLKNAEHLAEQGAAVVVEEGNDLSAHLQTAVQALLDEPKKAAQIAETLHRLLRPDAAHALAVLLLKEAKH